MKLIKWFHIYFSLELSDYKIFPLNVHLSFQLLTITITFACICNNFILESNCTFVPNLKKKKGILNFCIIKNGKEKLSEKRCFGPQLSSMYKHKKQGWKWEKNKADPVKHWNDSFQCADVDLSFFFCTPIFTVYFKMKRITWGSNKK